MLFSSEWLDLREAVLGLNKNLKNENPDHEFLIADAFDIVEEQESRSKFMDKVVRQCMEQAK